MLSLWERRSHKEILLWPVKETKTMGDASITASSSNNLAEVLTVSSSTVDNEWIMDSGCSFHMCPNIEWFQILVAKK